MPGAVSGGQMCKLWYKTCRNFSEEPVGLIPLIKS